MYLLEIFCVSLLSVIHITSLAYPIFTYSRHNSSIRLFDSIGAATIVTLVFLTGYGMLKLSNLPAYHASAYYLAALGPIHVALHSVLYRRELSTLKTYIVNKFSPKKSKEVDLDSLLKEADEILSLETSR